MKYQTGLCPNNRWRYRWCGGGGTSGGSGGTGGSGGSGGGRTRRTRSSGSMGSAVLKTGGGSAISFRNCPDGEYFIVSRGLPVLKVPLLSKASDLPSVGGTNYYGIDTMLGAARIGATANSIEYLVNQREVKFFLPKWNQRAQTRTKQLMNSLVAARATGVDVYFSGYYDFPFRTDGLADDSSWNRRSGAKGADSAKKKFDKFKTGTKGGFVEQFLIPNSTNGALLPALNIESTYGTNKTPSYRRRARVASRPITNDDERKKR